MEDKMTIAQAITYLLRHLRTLNRRSYKAALVHTCIQLKNENDSREIFNALEPTALIPPNWERRRLESLRIPAEYRIGLMLPSELRDLVFGPPQH